MAEATVAVAVVGSVAAVAGTVGENVSFDAPQRGVGGKGWRGDKTWRNNVKRVSEGGNVRNLDGGLPTEAEAKDLIREANGKIGNTHPAHYDDGINTHLYPHIHYETATGTSGTIEIIKEIFP